MASSNTTKIKDERVLEKNNEENAFASLAMALLSASTTHVVLKAVLELDIIKKVGHNSSTNEIMAHLLAKNPDAVSMIDRMLRLLASQFVLTCTIRSLLNGLVERFYGLTPVCKFLNKDENGASLAQLEYMNKRIIGFGYELKDAILEGGHPFERAYNMSQLEYNAQNPDVTQKFNAAMACHSKLTMDKILKTYKVFEGLSSLVDVGGSNGATLNVILSKYPTIKGINFDLPFVINFASPCSAFKAPMINGTQQNYDRTKDLKAFDERKTGVKGLVDEGSKTIPSIFVRPPNDRSKDLSTNNDQNLSVPIIDMSHFGDDDEIISDHQATTKIVEEIIWASQNWGFFQVINHGIPLELMENMIEGTRMFHEQDDETKKKFYSRDSSKVVTFNSNYDFYKSNAANWRDTFSVNTSFNGILDPQELPPMCKEVIVEYIKKVTKLGETILELISMGLGLKAEYLKEMLECTKAWNLACHYYPACPEPDLTLGTSKHADASFITILLQDQIIGGLQVLHFNQWVHVHPLKGAFIVNIGDALQMVCNDKVKSVYHRVVAKSIGPRISIALFFKGLFGSPKLYGPIKELLSEDDPPIYRPFTLEEFLTHFVTRPLDQPGIDHFKLTNNINSAHHH